MTAYRDFINENEQELYDLLHELCKIPAPSNYEDERAKFCKNWLEACGAKGVYIDSAKNTVFPYKCEGSSRITVIVAHTDTVFPDTEPMPYREEDGKIYCPGVGDDTASLSVMLMTAKYCVENDVKADGGILFVANACEEGLGNLKGTRQIFADYEGRVEKFVSLDSNISAMCDVCVGSHRYELTVKTEGGHSFQNFGNNSAIHKISEIITKIYEIEVPKKEGTRTTYNVGIISGGTSVNTIAENASMLCEYRSNDVDCLAEMEKKFASIFASVENEKVSVSVNLVGNRPCACGLDPEKQEALAVFLSDIVESVSGQAPKRCSGSTDCNIPMSIGIPAVCIGVYTGGGTHTRGEWVEKASLIPGLEIAIKLVSVL